MLKTKRDESQKKLMDYHVLNNIDIRRNIHCSASTICLIRSLQLRYFRISISSLVVIIFVCNNMILKDCPPPLGMGIQKIDFSFRLTNTQALFIIAINNMLHMFLVNFVAMFVGNILIY